MWCIPAVTPEFKQKMLDVLEVYERPYNPQKPVVCLDEKSKQLLKETRTPVAGKPGQPARTDYEYKRNGTCNLFVAVEPKGKKRIVRVTRRRKKKDYASFLKYLVDGVYKNAETIVLVEDNLNTHNKQSLIEEFGENEGNRIAEKIEWHYTPKHASWLNQAEIEIAVLSKQCLKQAIPTFQKMQHEVACWVKDRNAKEKGINWKFTREKAIEKFNLDYPSYL